MSLTSDEAEDHQPKDVETPEEVRERLGDLAPEKWLEAPYARRNGNSAFHIPERFEPDLPKCVVERGEEKRAQIDYQLVDDEEVRADHLCRLCDPEAEVDYCNYGSELVKSLVELNPEDLGLSPLGSREGSP